jgi:hypothetical protein
MAWCGQSFMDGGRDGYLLSRARGQEHFRRMAATLSLTHPSLLPGSACCAAEIGAIDRGSTSASRHAGTGRGRHRDRRARTPVDPARPRQ